MSGKLMGAVYEREFNHGQQSVLLAMADHAQDDGSDCFPAIGRVAWKTGYSDRQVKRIIKELREAGVLIEVAPAGRRHPVEYHIELAAAKAKDPYVPRGDKRDNGGGGRGDNDGGLGVTNDDVRGDTAASPEPSDEPSGGTSRPSDVDGIFKFWGERLMPGQPKFTDARKRKVNQRLDEGFTPREVCEAIVGITLSPYHMGDNDRGPKGTGKRFVDLTLICRDAEHVEDFRDTYREHKATESAESPGERANRRRREARQAQEG